MFKPTVVLLILTLLLSACDWGRTPSKVRFEKNCHITIPGDATVMKDEYEDMGSDYVINYTLRLPASSLKDFIKSIQESDYYNGTVLLEQQTNDNILKGKVDDKGVWRRSIQGYKFYKRVGGREYTQYKIDLDTTSRIASFEESAN
jgi:hypothetical protein